MSIDRYKENQSLNNTYIADIIQDVPIYTVFSNILIIHADSLPITPQ